MAGVISRGEQISLRLARQHWWCTRHRRDRRHAFLWRHIVFVVEKLLVIYLQIRRQKTNIRSIMEGGEDQIADPYKRIRAMRERASVRLEPISKSCEITQANNLSHRERLSRKAQCLK